MLSPDSRPYDPTVLERLTEHMIMNGPVVSSPIPDAMPGQVAPEVVDHNPQSNIAIRGLSRLIKGESSRELSQRKAVAINKRVSVARVMGEMMENPRHLTRNPNNPEAKFGWIGTDKRTIEDGKKPVDPYDFTDMHKLLFPSKDKTPVERVNPYRPTTRAENRVSRRLELNLEKHHKRANEARWLRRTVGSTDPNDLTLSGSERNHDGRLLRRARRLEKKAAKNTARFYKISASEDWRSKLTFWQSRLKKHQSRS